MHTSGHEFCDKGVPKYDKCALQLVSPNLGSYLILPVIEQWHQTSLYEQ